MAQPTSRADRLRLYTFAAPMRFYRLAGASLPWLWAAALLLSIAGLYVGFFVAPTDATQGDSYRIIFIHVPAAWLSMILYLALAFWAAIGWAFRARMASILARAIAPTGAMFTALALITGALWGQPTWGTWWVWDARLTSELLLLFLYLGYIALVNAIDDPRRADQAGALLALVGSVNVPVIYFSVKWWNTLHQGATISLTAAPKMAQTMLTAMLLTTFACWAYAFAVVFMRARAMALVRERHTQWVQELARGEATDGGSAGGGTTARSAQERTA
ncbi:MAG: cytochrome c biogenesis protein CcsA [Rubrivivax sp.]|nr:cytochrome c biogenesis protein CcsA [Rubrivivax sp.]MCL4697385.1 heme ABC transporter permease CcmC [Burkholderiaceae bacterium]